MSISDLSHAERSLLPARGTAGSSATVLADRWAACLCFALATALYAALGLRLAQGAYLDYFNLAFDFDPSRYVQTLVGSPPDFLGPKHPLMVLLRPLAWPFLWAGLAPKQAAVLVMSCTGGLTVAVCFAFLRRIGTGLAEALALAALFAVTGSQLFCSIITESYEFSLLAIAATWLVAAIRLENPLAARRWRYAIAVFTFGVTITNVVQSGIAELLVWLRATSFVEAVRRCLVFGLVLAAILAVLLAAVWFNDLMQIARDPVQAAKEFYWLRTKGERTGLGQILLTFLGYSFVSPEFTTLAIPGGIDMWDFRSFSFSSAGKVAIGLWAALLVSGVLGWCANARQRWLAAGIAAALLFNILFHMDFQFRGSLYLYAAHPHFLVFALAAGLAPLVRGRSALRAGYVGLVLLLTGFTAADNLSAALTFVRGFDAVHVDCAAPCADGLP